jgi:hypothetical protein
MSDSKNIEERLNSAGLKSSRVIKRSMLSDRHQRLRLAWCLARHGLNLRTWRRIHWSDENQFLLHVIDGQMTIWRQKNTAYTPMNIQPTVPYIGSPVMIWRCIYHECNLDLVTIRGKITSYQYIVDVLQPVALHLDNHQLSSRLVLMNNNARPHRSMALTSYLQSEAVTSLPWPAMNPDLNPLEHAWDMLGRRVQVVVPHV